MTGIEDARFKEWMQKSCWSGSVATHSALPGGFRAGWPVKTTYDWVNEWREKNEKERPLLDEFITEMNAAETGWLVAPYVIRFAHTVIGDIRALGRKIVTLGLKSEERPPNMDTYVRMSWLSLPSKDEERPCPIPAYVNKKQDELRIELIPHDDVARKRIEKGNLHHLFSLRDPEWQDVMYLPWHQLGDEIKLKEFCEVKLFGEIGYGSRHIPVEGTFDSSVGIGKNIFVTDYKTPEAPKPGRIPKVPVFHPYVGHQKQVTGYGMLLEEKTGLDAAIGMIAYLYRSLGGKGPTQRHFRIDKQSQSGKRNRERAAKSLMHIYDNICEFEDGPDMVFAHRNMQKYGPCDDCHYRGFCWNKDETGKSGLQVAIETIKTFK